MALLNSDMNEIAGLLATLPTFSGRPNPVGGMAPVLLKMGQQARQEEQRKQAAEKFQGLLGQRAQINPYQQSEAEMFPGEQPIPGLLSEQKGSGYLGGEIGQQEFYGGLLSVPGMEQVGAQGLLSSMQGSSPEWKLAEVGTEDGRMQRVAFNAANPAQMMPLGNPYEARSGVTVNTGGGPSTPGWKKVDENFAQEYIDWTAAGGFADVQKNVAQLDRALGSLESGEAKTGAGRGLVPDAAKAYFDPKSLATRQQVEEVVQRNLRLILGAQFTEKEGERLISRAFDENLPPEENIRRIQLLRNQIIDAAKAKQEAVKYFNQNGTLQGFEGKTYSKADFDADTFFKDEKSDKQQGGAKKRMRYNPETGQLEPVDG